MNTGHLTSPDCSDFSGLNLGRKEEQKSVSTCPTYFEDTTLI